MKLVYQVLDQGELENANEILDRYKPGNPLADLRGFEWYHLKRRLHGEWLTLAGHRGEVYAVTFSPDGRQVVSGGQDGTIRFWDTQSGQELKTISAHKSCVNVLAYAPGGAILASASCDDTIKIWDAATLQLLDTLEGHQNEVHCLAFCPTDGNLLAAGGHEPRVRLWNLQRAKSCARWRPRGMSMVSPGDAMAMRCTRPAAVRIYVTFRKGELLSGMWTMDVSKRFLGWRFPSRLRRSATFAMAA